MPEISFCLFDLRYLFKLFPKSDCEFDEKLKNFENSIEEEMVQNRNKLFAEYDYSGEF